jgi:hypothetical protein
MWILTSILVCFTLGKFVSILQQDMILSEYPMEGVDENWMMGKSGLWLPLDA